MTIQPAVEMNEKSYSQTVWLRQDTGGPIVKLAATNKEGSGLNLSDEADGGVQIRARSKDSFVKVTDQGKEQIVKP